jgi:hypothetical protein
MLKPKGEITTVSLISSGIGYSFVDRRDSFIYNRGKADE